MKGVSLGPLGPASYRGSWVENGLKQIERWINTIVAFRGATSARDGADGLVPQPKAGDENKVLYGDGKWDDPAGGSGGGASGSPGSIQIADGGGGFTSDADFIYDSTTDTLYAKNVFVVDDPYGPTWNGSNLVPTKNALYDKIESMAAAAGAVPVFFTPSPFTVTPTAGRQEYVVMAAALTVTATSKFVWAMLQLTGSGTVKKKLTKNYPWSFDVQLRRGSPGAYFYVSLATASVTIKSSGVPNRFGLSLQGFRPALALGVYDVVLISNFTGPIAPGSLQLSVMGQVP